MQQVQYEMSLRDLVTPGLQNAERGAQHFEGVLGNLQEKIKTFAEVAGIAFGLEKIWEWGKEILNVTAEFQGFDNVIKYSSINQKDAAANLDYISEATKRLHLPITEAYQSFSEMQAGFYGTAIEGQKLRDVFEGVSEAATVLHLNAEKFGRVTFALKEIGELGTVQARQMRMLAFSLPGAMNIAAQSMHMSTVQFHEAMKRGEIDSGTFLTAFSGKLKETFGAGLANAGESLISKMNDTKTSVVQLMLNIGNTLEPVFSAILGSISNTLNSISALFTRFVKSIDFDTITKGFAKVTATLMQFAPEVNAVFTWIKEGFASLFQLLGPIFNYVVNIISGIIDVLHTVMVLLEKLGILSFIGKVLQTVWYIIQQIGDALVWLYDHTLKPIFDKLGEWYDKLKDILGIKSTVTVAASIEDKIHGPKKEAGTDIYAGRGKGMAAGGESETSKLGKATSKVNGKSVTITISIAALVKELNINTSNFKEGVNKAQEMVTSALLSAVNDSQIVAGN